MNPTASRYRDIYQKSKSKSASAKNMKSNSASAAAMSIQDSIDASVDIENLPEVCTDNDIIDYSGILTNLNRIGSGALNNVYEIPSNSYVIKVPKISCDSQNIKVELDVTSLISAVIHNQDNVLLPSNANNIPENVLRILTENTIPFLVYKKYTCTLKQYMIDYYESVTIDDIIIVVNNIISAISELHKVGFLHCDIKPENIFLELNNSNRVTKAVLADFGHAVKIDEQIVKLGTPQYIHPLLYLDKKPQDLTCVDKWSFACVIVNMLTMYKRNEHYGYLHMLPSANDIALNGNGVHIEHMYSNTMKDYITIINNIKIPLMPSLTSVNKPECPSSTDEACKIFKFLSVEDKETNNKILLLCQTVTTILSCIIPTPPQGKPHNKRYIHKQK